MIQLIGPLLLVGATLLALSSRRPKANPIFQELFEVFHAKIKLDEHDERRNLRVKRETLLNVLRGKLSHVDLPFEWFHQGSYAMRTGVVPKDGNYDIDVGLIFECGVERFPDPVALKCIVRDALNGYNRTVVIRRPCVTVTYQRNGLPEFHVDLAVYMRQPNGSLVIAMGREFSKPEQREWVPAAPGELTQFVISSFSGGEQAQLRRCIRYLKRWRDENFIDGAPLSIALTLAAARWFEPKMLEDGTFVDLEALHCLVKTMQGKFELGLFSNKLVVSLPGSVKGDLMARLSAPQMSAFSEQLNILASVIEKCFGDGPRGDAARVLASTFGSDFPIPVEGSC